MVLLTIEETRARLAAARALLVEAETAIDAARSRAGLSGRASDVDALRKAQGRRSECADAVETAEAGLRAAELQDAEAVAAVRAAAVEVARVEAVGHDQRAAELLQETHRFLLGVTAELDRLDGAAKAINRAADDLRDRGVPAARRVHAMSWYERSWLPLQAALEHLARMTE